LRASEVPATSISVATRKLARLAGSATATGVDGAEPVVPGVAADLPVGPALLATVTG
jgi:hypothetical protein